MHDDGAPHGNILVVDDTPANLRLLAGMLTEHHYKVRPVPNGSLALGAAKAVPPDLILLDINMPGMNGYEVCQALKADPTTRDIPVIFISALDEVMDKVRAFEVGGVDYITKPFQFAEVIARVETHLSLRWFRQKLEEANQYLEKRVQERTAELFQLHAASDRFVPQEFLAHLNKNTITDVFLGDQVQREMTVMFSDIRNFTTLSEKMTPQENFNFLNDYLSRISPIIRQHKGFIDKYMGDGIMALFPESVDTALEAAVGMRHEVARYNERLQSQGQKSISIGIGLNTGKLMLGILGEERRLQGTVISDVVNLASRFEGLNKLYKTSIITCEYTLSCLQQPANFHFRMIDRVRVKGKNNATTVYEVFDGDPEDLFQLKMQTQPTFSEGIELYLERKFAKAILAFAVVVRKNPQDKAAELYLERCGLRLENGVSDSWSGIENLDSKFD
ncbi:MAG TPA: adenylate/guanylate cyclase domain-containing protein [Anaerolineales bacterium]|nr:adenylate/guanylate cyclase domain-containing protein [Anaerolineales bacterium]